MGIVDDEPADDDFSAIAEVDSSMLDGSSYGFADDLLDSLMDESDEDGLSMYLPEINIDSSWLPNSGETEVVVATVKQQPIELEPTKDIITQIKAASDEIARVVASVTQEPIELEPAKDPITKVKAARDEIEDFLSSTFDFDQPIVKNPEA